MQIRTKYEKKLQGIDIKLTQMCIHVESAMEKCVKLLAEKDFNIAIEVEKERRLNLVPEIRKEKKRVSKLGRKTEQACMKLLVMEQPVAGDFRKISAIMKIIADLERIGEQVWDITKLVHQADQIYIIHELDNVSKMAVAAMQMVENCVQACTGNDLELARSLGTIDDKVDALFKIIKSDIVALIKKDSNYAEHAIMLMMITKYLERVGDHAENIGEWVEYAITGTHPKRMASKTE